MGIRGFNGDELSIAEIFGLKPYAARLQDAVLTFRGDPNTPKSRVDHTSLRQLKPKLSVMTWAGWFRRDRRAVISNLFNRTPTPPEDGWSVRVTQVLDFRGGELTYDSHNGTDFALPLGTPIVTSAPGLVCRVSNEFNRGGLKVVVDHGHGMITTYNHLARALVKPGDLVERGDVVALSGYSGIDGLLLFPWSVPHLHYNVFFNGKNDDPFACEGEESLWRHGNWPTPWTPGEQVEQDQAIEPTAWDMDAVENGINDCIDPELQDEMRRIDHDQIRAVTLTFYQCYYPTRFRQTYNLQTKTYPRQGILDLPMQATDFQGVHFPDGIKPAR